jgi:hypothetical protein
MEHRTQRAEVERVRNEMEEGKGKERVRDVGIEEVVGLGPSVKGMVGMGRI